MLMVEENFKHMHCLKNHQVRGVVTIKDKIIMMKAETTPPQFELWR
ncbi:hypothetical protein AND4_19257 [Vibrio sp. AND4]|nr:hypothetical protein AND4_19257 [Vibrio sp. AND4]